MVRSTRINWILKSPCCSVLFVLFALVAPTGSGQAQQPIAPADDTKARIECLEKEVHELKAMLQQQAATVAAPAQPDPEALQQLIDQKVKEIMATEQSKKGDDKQASNPGIAQDGFVVGDNLVLKAMWDSGGLRFNSPDEAFTIHIGGRLMTDEIWFTQSPALTLPAAQPKGSPLVNYTGVGPGIDDLQDGFFLRRARIVADGRIFQTIEYKVEFDFENYNNLLFDESYVGARDLPYIDTFRFGQMHVPFGLEAYASSRFLPMMERSPQFDAFYEEFAPGIFTDTTFFDQHVTTQHMFHRVDNFSQFNGASFGDGKYAYSGRVTVLPIYENDGRCLLHLGFAYQWRKGGLPPDFNGGNTTAPANSDLVEFRARFSGRDTVGTQGDGARVVDTGPIIANHVQSVNGELLWYWNAFWVQSEAVFAHVTDARYPALPTATARGDLNYYGWYVQVGYFLTGDNRGYDKRMGKYDRVRPLENFFLVRDDNGKIQYGLGAWELIYRYGYVNLDSDHVLGGLYGESTIGLNWYWNSNVKFQFNYVYGQRVVPAPANDGQVQSFGIRAALEF